MVLVTIKRSAAIAPLAVAAVVTAATVAFAGGGQSGQVCDGLTSGKIDTTGSPASVTITASEGYLIDEYCVKAGSVEQGNGPQYHEVNPPVASLTITYTDKDGKGKAISHYSWSEVAINSPSTTTSATIQPTGTTSTTTQPTTSTTTTQPTTSTTTQPTDTTSTTTSQTTKPNKPGEVTFSGIFCDGLPVTSPINQILISTSGHVRFEPEPDQTVGSDHYWWIETPQSLTIKAYSGDKKIFEKTFEGFCKPSTGTRTETAGTPSSTPATSQTSATTQANAPVVTESSGTSEATTAGPQAEELAFTGANTYYWLAIAGGLLALAVLMYWLMRLGSARNESQH